MILSYNNRLSAFSSIVQSEQVFLGAEGKVRFISLWTMGEAQHPEQQIIVVTNQIYFT